MHTPPVSEAPDAGPPASRDTSLADERTLLEVARTALARDDTAGALQALRAHEARYASGRLVEEREALVVVALVHAGRRGEAEARAREFRARWPDSLLLPSVDAALAP